MPSNTQAMRIEGQDSTNGLIYTQSMTQPSVDAIQEFAVQTSNYAAEYGQVGRRLFNVTMKSGTNTFHGSGYEYFVNEALNAGTPFTNDGNGHLLRTRQRRNDYGFTLGGPVEIPKVYNGHDKTFFFFNFEQFRETVINSTTPITVPTLHIASGDFSQALTEPQRLPGGYPTAIRSAARSWRTRFTIRSRRSVCQRPGQVRDPFPGNIVPAGAAGSGRAQGSGVDSAADKCRA